MPIQPAAMEGRFICQWDKDSCDDARVVKIDFLALGMLSLVEEALELIAEQGKGTVDLSRTISLRDLRHDLPGRHDRRLPDREPGPGADAAAHRARKLEDLVVQVAIVRPGPIIGGAVKPYVAHRQQERTSFLPIEPYYDHPARTGVAGNAWGDPLPGAGASGVDGAGGLFRRSVDALRRSMTRKRSR